ncbi:MAG TPA: hypothetical protein VNI01_01620 [Elusimicrobiota bacterium]|nr:hypothetical protein [Elusimicrobiota bacterium]
MPRSASLKRHYRRSLAGLGGRLHFAAHSHHLWPDVTRAAVLRCWDDAARFSDRKWERVLGEVLPSAQRRVARILGLSRPGQLAFAPNTHELLCRLLSCLDWSRPIRILTTDGEFHSLRRQLARLSELPSVHIEEVPTEPFATFEERFLKALRGRWDLVYLSQVFFDSGFVVERLSDVADAAPPNALLAIDGYHAFCAVPTELRRVEKRAFYLAGGYKYAQAGEGACFLAVPPGCALRPLYTGWFADFDSLERPARGPVAYGPGAYRFWGATFDPSGLYRLDAALGWLSSRGLTTARVHSRIVGLQDAFLSLLGPGLGSLRRSSLLTPIGRRDRAHFLAFRMPGAAAFSRRLARAGVDTDVRADRIRFGFGLYQDESDVRELCRRLARL